MMASVGVQSAPGNPTTETIYSPQKLPSLRSNRGECVDQSSTGWMRSTSVDTSIEEMRKRFRADGYLWIKHLIPREDVLDMREHYFQQMAPSGILLPQTSPRDGIFNAALDPMMYQGLGGTPEQSSFELLEAAHTTPEFRTFLAHPNLRGFIRNFMQWKQEVILKRALLRHNCPGSMSTGIHYDQLFLRGGEAEFLTAWVPIGDCAPTGGGLMYLENSGELGRKIEENFARKAEDLSAEEKASAFNKYMTKDAYLSHDAEEFRRASAKGHGRWLVGDYEAGDVVFHDPYMIHAATKNEDELGRIRLASDLRFYEEGAALDQRWMNLFKHDDGL